MKKTKPLFEKITQNPLYLFVFVLGSLYAYLLLVTKINEWAVWIGSNLTRILS